MGSGRVLFILAMVGCLLMSGSGTAKSGKTWVVSVLEGPTDQTWLGTFVNDVSDSGFIGGGWVDGDGVWHASYWYRGKFHDLEAEIGIPSEAGSSMVNSVNSAGLMGGWAYLDDITYRRAVVWDVAAGEYVNLHPYGDGYVSSMVFTVNASGDAVGWAVKEDGTQEAWVWPKDGQGEALPGLDEYDNSRAKGINSSGTIVGQGQDGTWTFWPGTPWEMELARWVPLIWEKKGGTFEIADLRDYFEDGYPMIRALDVSESGEVIGRRHDENLLTSVWSWTAADGVALLENDEGGDASVWRIVGKTIAGGVGLGAFGNWDEMEWIVDDAAVWNDGELEIVAADVVYGGDTHQYVEASSVNRKGVVGGFCFYLPDDYEWGVDPPLQPLGWVAEKK